MRREEGGSEEGGREGGRDGESRRGREFRKCCDDNTRHVLLQKSASKVVLGGGLSREKEGWMRAPTHKTCNNALC